MTVMRTLVTLVTLLSGLGACVSAQSQNAIDPVWEEKIYKEVDGQSLRAFVFPAVAGQNAGAHPAIAFFHGGGWVFGRPQEFFGACERFARQGFTTISFEYRLSRNADGTWPKPGVSPIESVKGSRNTSGVDSLQTRTAARRILFVNRGGVRRRTFRARRSGV